MWSCPSCGANVDDAVDRCWGCGWRQTEAPETHAGASPEPGPRPDEEPRGEGDWTCPKCLEIVDAPFDVCWNCGTTADGVENPHFVREQDAGANSDDEGDDAEVFHQRREPPAQPRPERCPTCRRCERAMIEGYLAFPAGRATARTVPVSGAWCAGRTWWTPRRETTEGVAFLPLRAYRCPGCGVVEIFAPS